MGERLHQPPGVEARQELGLAPQSPPPSRWSVRALRASVAALANYSLSGVWRLMQRRPLRDHLYSPDPEYVAKVAHLERCLREAVRWPQGVVVVVFLDEMGYYRWPEVVPDWQVVAPGYRGGPPGAHGRADQPPAAPHRCAQRAHWPGGLGLPGQLSGWPRAGQRLLPAPRSDVYVGAAHLRRLVQLVDHSHDDVTATLRHLPRLAPVWLPTCAPWLNPIEMLWHWWRRDVLTAHRLTASPMIGRSGATRSTPSSISSPMARPPYCALSAWLAMVT